ncbi:MAG: IMP dehydrogenase [Patescibacteria group bacterium]|nr:IMP dehydrogenase [Patescibacteria group bacterium]
MTKLHPTLKNKEFWYKDLILVCNHLPDLEREDVDLTTQFSRNIKLKTPFVSSPMDTVTGAEMAIVMALMGGIGVIHYNYETIEDQMMEVEKVKRFEAAFVHKPVVLSPKNTVGDIYKIAEEHGFYSVPITKDGTLESELVGIVTHRDVRYLETKKEMKITLAKIMTPRSKLVTISKEKTLDKNDIETANEIIRKHNLDTLPIVDRNFHLVAIVTDSDLRKNEMYPLATKDKNKQLKVLVAVESRLSLAKERIERAAEMGVDGIIIDASVVFKEHLQIAKYAKKKFPQLEVILGNVDSGKMVSKIMKSGHRWVDAIRVGIGPGAACITQEYLGIGRAQASAIWDCSQSAKRFARKSGYAVPLIADGGIKKPSDIVKALALGSQTVMMGGLLAGLEESPGEAGFDEELGYLVKKYRGMGSLEAMAKRGAIRYRIDKSRIKIPEGKVTRVGYKGSGYNFIPKLIAAVKQSMQKLNCKDIVSLQKNVDIRPNSIV